MINKINLRRPSDSRDTSCFSMLDVARKTNEIIDHLQEKEKPETEPGEEWEINQVFCAGCSNWVDLKPDKSGGCFFYHCGKCNFNLIEMKRK